MSKIAKSYSKKVGDSSWTLPGGHIEDNENPVDAAQREAMEELGINIRFIHEHKLFPDEDSAKSLPTPFGSFAHIVSSDGKLKQSHENVILAYVVYPIGIPAAVEHQSIKWFSDNDLRGPGVHRIAAKIAIAGLKHIERKY